MTLRLMVWTAVIAALAGARLGAQQQPNSSDQTPQPSSTAQPSSGTRASLQLTIPTWIVTPPPKKWGIFTLTQPDTDGEILQLSVPIGELVMRPVHAIGQARYRRAERSARREVQQAIKDFQATQR